MLVRRIVGMNLSCEGGNCPNTYATDRATTLVQGDAVAGRPRNVRVPQDLLDRHAAAVGATRWIAATEDAGDGMVLVDGEPVTDAAVLARIGVPAHEHLVELVEAVAA